MTLRDVLGYDRKGTARRSPTILVQIHSLSVLVMMFS
jgi:hypothetical protein